MSETPAEQSAVDKTLPENAGSSVVDRIRERHAKRSRHVDLAIPDWDGDVVVRYRRVSRKAIVAAQQTRNAAVGNARVLSSSCVEVFVRDPDTGDLAPASKGDGHPGAVRFDGRLADMFALPGDTPEQIARAIYADDVALGAHAQRLLNWQTGAELDESTSEELEDLAGEG